MGEGGIAGEGAEAVAGGLGNTDEAILAPSGAPLVADVPGVGDWVIADSL